MALDVPPVVAELVEDPEPDPPYGVKGVGEPPRSSPPQRSSPRCARPRPALTQVPVRRTRSSVCGGRRAHGVTLYAPGVAEPTHPRPVDPAELGFETIVYEKAPPRATIRLNRPDVLNAFDFQMLREIARACEDASWDDEIRVVVVTGTGRAFCVGADLRSWDEDYLGRPGEYWKWFGAFKDMHDRLREIGKPTIARINGIAVGGGNELQMACDLAVMVDDAFIRHVGLEHGSVPAGGATQWLQLMVGDRRAREIILLCDEIPAARPAEWGLVNRAVPGRRARRRRRRLGREPRAQAAAGDAVREAAAERLARPRLAPDGRSRPRLARAVDARGRDAGRRPRFLEAAPAFVGCRACRRC